jgi:hypothetical protein
MPGQVGLEGLLGQPCGERRLVPHPLDRHQQRFGIPGLDQQGINFGDSIVKLKPTLAAPQPQAPGFGAA